MIKTFEGYVGDTVHIPDLSSKIGKILDDNMIAWLRGTELHLKFKLLNEKIKSRVKFESTHGGITSERIYDIMIRTKQHVWYENYILDSLEILFYIPFDNSPYSSGKLYIPVKQNQDVEILENKQVISDEDPYGEEDWDD